MTKEELEARKREAERTIEHWYGVIADCNYWLEKLGKKPIGDAAPKLVPDDGPITNAPTLFPGKTP
jgi:hypothetical protein